MMEKNLFGLLYFVSLIIVTTSSGAQFDEYRTLKVYQKIMTIFIKAINSELKPNGKYIDNAFYDIGHYSIDYNSRIDDFMKLCIEELRRFDDVLTTKPSEVMFLSFYYKMLKWLNYHLSQVQGVKVFNLSLNDAINGIITKRGISGDIMTVFDRKIYSIKVPKQLVLYGEEADQAIKLIYDIEDRFVSINDESRSFKTGGGREKFHELICCYFVQCKKIEVYENIIRRLDNNNEDYGNYDVSHRKLELIGVIDIALIFFRGEFKNKAIDYSKIDLSNYTRGTVAHFKYASILFIRAVETSVLSVLGELIDVEYEFEKAYIENYSTRDKAFYLRLCGLNAQVHNALNTLGQSYTTYLDKLTDEKIRVIFYRLLKWFSKYAKFRACAYTEGKINEILSIIQDYTPVSAEIQSIKIPRGINTLEQLIKFGTAEKNEIDSESLPEEDDNNDTFVPEDKPLHDVENPPHEEDYESWLDPPEKVEIIRVKSNGPGKQNSNNSFGRTSSFINVGYWIESISSFFGPPLSSIKNNVIDKLKTYKIL